jgi:hypothetical protein
MDVGTLHANHLYRVRQCRRSNPPRMLGHEGRIGKMRLRAGSNYDAMVLNMAEACNKVERCDPEEVPPNRSMRYPYPMVAAA